MLIYNLRGTYYFAPSLALFVVFLSKSLLFLRDKAYQIDYSDSGVMACQSGSHKQLAGPFVTPVIWLEAAQALGFDEISGRRRFQAWHIQYAISHPKQTEQELFAKALLQGNNVFASCETALEGKWVLGYYSAHLFSLLFTNQR